VFHFVPPFHSDDVKLPVVSKEKHRVRPGAQCLVNPQVWLLGLNGFEPFKSSHRFQRWNLSAVACPNKISNFSSLQQSINQYQLKVDSTAILIFSDKVLQQSKNHLVYLQLFFLKESFHPYQEYKLPYFLNVNRFHNSILCPYSFSLDLFNNLVDYY
jgi:hypothetical protein